MHSIKISDQSVIRIRRYSTLVIRIFPYKMTKINYLKILSYYNYIWLRGPFSGSRFLIIFANLIDNMILKVLWNKNRESWYKNECFLRLGYYCAYFTSIESLFQWPTADSPIIEIGLNLAFFTRDFPNLHADSD